MFGFTKTFLQETEVFQCYAIIREMFSRMKENLYA